MLLNRTGNSLLADNWKIFYPTVERTQLRFIHYEKTKPVRNVLFKRENYATDTEYQAAIETSVINHNDLGFNVYQPVNIINDDFNGEAVGNADVFSLDKLFVDIDRAGDKSEPATTEELARAWELKLDVEKFLVAQGWPAPHVVMSGNGYHLYWLLDDEDDFLDPSINNIGLIRDLLHFLGNKFDNAAVKIDRGVHNPARITKFIGTIARKGTASEDRPYRRVTLCQKPSDEAVRYVSKAMIEELFNKHHAPIATGKTKPRVSGIAWSTPSSLSPRGLAILKDQLEYIDPNCGYEIWRDVVFAILSTGAPDAERLALKWSQGAPEKFSETAFDTLVKSFSHGRTGSNGVITVGTIWHHARLGGWHG